MTNPSPSTPLSYRLFAGNMWPVYNFDDANVRYRKFCARARPAFKTMLEGVLLHEEIVIPTDDFLSLTGLVGVLGESAILALIEAGCLRFLRAKGALAYIGNGAGLRYFEIASSEGTEHSFCAPLDAAIDWALRGLDKPPNSPKLRDAVIQVTRELSLGEIEQEVRHETYMDVLKSPHLRQFFALRNHDLDQLAGIGPKNVQIHGGPDSNWQGDEIGVVLALAATNLELRMLQLAECSDASTASPVGHLLRAKAERCCGEHASSGFAVLREIANLPDIGESILQGSTAVDRLIRLRQSRNVEQFRCWFHENCRSDPLGTAREYAKLLEEVPPVRSLPARVLRFIITATLGLLPGGTLIGTAAGAIDSFLLDGWFSGHSPKLFIDDLRQFQ